MSAFRKFICSSEILLGCLGLAGGLVLFGYFFIGRFELRSDELGYWILLLGPTLVVIGLASVLPIVLLLCGTIEYRILLDRVKQIIPARIVICCALFLTLGGFILTFPYSTRTPIPGLNVFSRQAATATHSVVLLWAATFAWFVWLPVLAKIFAIVVVWIHLALNGLSLLAFAVRKGRTVALASTLALLVPVLSPIYLARVSRQIAPPQKLSAGNYFINPANLGLPWRYRVKLLRWDDRTKGYDATAGLWATVDDGHTREGVEVALAFFASLDKARQRFRNDLTDLSDTQRSRAGGLYQPYVRPIPLEDEAFINEPYPYRLETANGKVVLILYWANTQRQSRVPPYVLEMVRTLASNVRQDFVR